MTNIEKEIITYQILTRGTAAELGAPAQDPQAWVEANAAYHSGTSYRGTLLGMVTRVLRRFKSTKILGPRWAPFPACIHNYPWAYSCNGIVQK